MLCARRTQLFIAALILCVAWWLGTRPSQKQASLVHLCRNAGPPDSPVVCPKQPSPLSKGQDWFPSENATLRHEAQVKLAGAIAIRTETFDDMPLDASNPSFDVFSELEMYLRSSFPSFHRELRFERINHHGLLFTWAGKTAHLKPIVLMAHQDVVPVNPATEALWTYPPFSGHMDTDGWIWGRGTTDMKGTKNCFPRGINQIVIFSFGFDEEIGGTRGAKLLAGHLLQRYGKNGLALVLDEGFTGVDEEFGRTFARVGIAEKGCLSIKLSVHTPGGHSSAPPDNTGIGIMSQLLVELENHPMIPSLREDNPLLSYLECAVEHGTVEPDLAHQVRHKHCWSGLARTINEDRVRRTFLGTTQAIDVIHGGIKFNALPEMVSAIVNYRISFFETSKEIIDRVVGILAPIISQHNMTFDIQGSNALTRDNVVRLDTYGILIEPAPISPTNGSAFDLLGGTIRAQFPTAIVTASAMTAFTDTQYYWTLTPNIYRFVPASLKHIENYHTVDERIHIDAHLSVTRFMYKLMRNLEGWDAE